MTRNMTPYVLPIAVGTALLLALPAFAQGMMKPTLSGTTVSAADKAQTAQDEAEGKALFDSLRTNAISCDSLTEDDFDKLGDYYMGLMMGDSHAAMNASLVRRLGEDGEKRMHVAMGQRMSGCGVNAAYPPEFDGFGGMMGSSWRAQDLERAAQAYGTSSNAPLMHDWQNAITVLLKWTLMLCGIIALVKWTLMQKK